MRRATMLSLVLSVASAPRTTHAIGSDLDYCPYSFGPMDERAAGFGRAYAYLQQFLEARAAQPAQGDLVDVILAGVDRDGAPCP